MRSRKQRLKLNTVTSLAYQIVAIVCGFVLPRLILQTYGSRVNGLVNSITQFLHIIAFLEMGVGAVVQSTLYGPLAGKDETQVSKILASAQKFFSKLGTILLIYVVGLMLVFPLIAEQNFGWMYTAVLIAALSTSSFAQYYFGMVDSLLLKADQHGYVLYTAQLLTVVLNTIASTALIYAGAGIHLVKLTTSAVYLIRPILTRMYVNKHYKVDRRITYEGEPIKQKHNGVAQHIAAVVLDGTDNIVLTMFSTLAYVSIYSVYNLVVANVKNLFISITNGVQSLMGELWARQELKELEKVFGRFEWFVHTGVVFVFGCTGILILPFVEVYTQGVTDADYIQPVFAALITLAQAGHCLRLPYNQMILAAGHYKQTQINYIIAASINIFLSIVLVVKLGLVGVALGTVVAMLYQTIWMAVYISRNLNKWPLRSFVKQIAVDVLTVVFATYVSQQIKMDSISYVAWIVMAVKIALIWGGVVLLVNLVFYRKNVVSTAKGNLIAKSEQDA